MNMSKRFNDEDRRLFVINDEFFYLEAQQYRGGTGAYIKTHRQEIDKAMRATADGTRRQHSGPTRRYLT